MFKFKIKWTLVFHSVEELEAQFSLKNTVVVPSSFGKVLWIKHKNSFHAFKNNCPHQNKPMDQCWIDEGDVVCPFHKYHFSIEDGRGMGTSMHKYDVKIEDDQVWLGKEVFSIF